MIRLQKYFSLELISWIIALVYLAIINPAEQHFSFCLFNQLGVAWCPGCGVGHSISYLLHGKLLQSFQIHWMGTFAVVVIVYRVLQLLINNISNYKNQNYGKSVLRS